MRRLARAPTGAVLAALLAGAAGCEHRFFKAEGELVSEGGRLGSWRATPEGCTRDPQDGLPKGESKTLATFLWQDLRLHEPARQRHHPPNAPLRLEIRREDQGLAANLDTWDLDGGTRFAAADCSTLTIETHEGKPMMAGAKPTLAGTVTMDCRVADGHVAGEVKFSGCVY